MNDELERIWKEAPVAYSRYYPSICLEKLRKTTKTLSQNSRSPVRDSNLALSKYMSRALMYTRMLGKRKYR
jgi:hypothetical protein